MQPAAEEIKWYWALIGMAGSAAASVFGAGVYFKGMLSRIEKLETRSDGHDLAVASQNDALEALNREIKTRLYHPDGGLIYVRAADCDKQQANCPAKAAIESIGKKVDKLIDLHMHKKQ